MDKKTILLFLRDKAKKPLDFKDMASLMDLSRAESRLLKKILRQMVASGDILRTRRGLYVLALSSNLVSGYFEAHKDGYGFVITETPGERDIFIPSYATFGAMDNDRVIVKVENWHKRQGSIIRVIERATTKIVGRLKTEKGTRYVKPKNKFIAFDVYIPPGETGSARDGDTVIAEIVNYPTDRRSPSGRIVKIIEKPHDPRSDVEAIIEEFSVPQRFPQAVADEAKAIYKTYSAETAGDKRKDLRGLATITIDGESAKDFDDAVSIKLTEQGYRLWVHIADVGYFVPWDSPVDLEARKRGTSIYFPGRVIPMLPKELSDDLCSLRPKVDRLSFTVEIDFSRHGEIINTRFYPSIIRSDERMTYTSVRKILVDSDSAERSKYSYLLKDLDLMAELCSLLRGKRLGRGSLDFDLPEPEILLDIEGNPEAILKAERNFAHIIIEEFMIAANEAVAGHLSHSGVPSLFRVHEEPDSMSVENVLRVIKTISGFAKGHKVFRAGLTPGNLSSILDLVKNTSVEEIINYMVLRSLKQARYSPVNIGHFGLASKCYTHFTSPIRRYPDLAVHRILREALAKKHLPDTRIKELERLLPDIAFNSSKMERLADKIEKEVINSMRVWFMKDRVGEEFEGRVIGVTPHGIKIRLKDFYVEGFLHISHMTDDFYQYNERSLSLHGRNTRRSFSIGKDVKLRVDKTDIEEREIVFGLC